MLCHDRSLHTVVNFFFCQDYTFPVKKLMIWDVTGSVLRPVLCPLNRPSYPKLKLVTSINIVPSIWIVSEYVLLGAMRYVTNLPKSQTPTISSGTSKSHVVEHAIYCHVKL